MAFASISHLAILLAAVAGWIVGAIWYTIFGKAWQRSLRKTPEQVQADRRTGARAAAPFVIVFICDVVMAFVLAGAIGHLGPGQVTVRNGVISGGILWVGFILTTILANNAFAMRSTTLTLIDAGHWLAVLIVMGLIIGSFGG